MPAPTVRRPNGKGTERMAANEIRRFYGLNVIIERLPDAFDTGHYEDIRPSDLLLVFAPGVLSPTKTSAYIECKESAARDPKFNFKCLRKGQLQALHRTHALKIPYFVLYQRLDTLKIYLIPSTVIVPALLAGKKSLTAEQLLPFVWKNLGELYDPFMA